MPTTYTFAKKNPNTLAEGSTLSHFMNQQNDGARVAIQGIGNGPMTTDASASIVSSPVAVSPTSATTLTTPESAVEVTFVTATRTVNISEVSASVTTYFPVFAGTPITIDVANCAALYAMSAAGTTATLNFIYNLV